MKSLKFTIEEVLEEHEALGYKIDAIKNKVNGLRKCVAAGYTKTKLLEIEQDLIKLNNLG